MSNKSYKQRLYARFRKNKISTALLYYTGEVPRPKKWIFIIGCYNSGTTLLDEILTQHAQIGGLNDEGVMLSNRLPRPEDFGWRRMWVKCENEMAIPAATADTIAIEIKRHWSHFFTKKKPLLIEKSISNTPRALFFNDYFKPAYFIHIVRNGYAVSEGIKRKAAIMPGNPLYGLAHYPIELCATQWVRSLEVVEAQKQQLENLLEISYEQLTGNPDETIRTVCDFLGIPPFTHSLRDVSFTVHQSKEAIRNMNESSFRKLSAEEIISINKVAKLYLEKYKYPIPGQ